jgi:hypothetical protein
VNLAESGAAGALCADDAVEDTLTEDDENCDQRTGWLLWSHSYGDFKEQSGGDLALDEAGNLHATGYYDGALDFDLKQPLTPSGASNVWIAKLYASGKAAWSRGFGDADVQSGKGVGVDRDGNVIVAGPFQGSIDFGKGVLTASGRDFYVVKLDANGHTLWAKSFGGAGFQDAQALAVDQDDNIVISGVFEGSLSFATGVPPLETTALSDRDAFVAKLDPDGNHLWSKSSGGKGAQLLLGLSVDPQGDVLAAGTFENEFPLADLKLEDTIQVQALALKLDGETGQLRWGKHLGASQPYLATKAIASDSSGAIYVTTAFAGGWPEAGEFHGDVDLLVVKLDSSGGLVWTRLWGTPQREWGDALTVDSAGDVTVAAGFYGALNVGQGPHQSQGEHDIALMKLDADGNVRWLSHFGNAAGQRVAALKADAAGIVTMLATNAGNLDLGGAQVTGFGSNDIVLARFQR